MPYSEQDKEIYEMALRLRDSSTSEVIQQAKEHGRYGDTGPGARIVRELSGRLYRAVKAYTGKRARKTPSGAPSGREKAQEILRKFHPHVLAGITIDHIVNALASDERRVVSKMRGAIGRALNEYYKVSCAAKANPSLWSGIQRRYYTSIAQGKPGRAVEMLANLWKNEETEEGEKILEDEDILILGATMLELTLDCLPDVFETEGFYTKTLQNRRKRTVYYIRFTQSFRDKCGDLDKIYAQVIPLNLPLTELPLDWTSAVDGGFYSNALFRHPVLKARTKDAVEALQESTCPDLYKAINTLQRVSWEINNDIVEVYREAADAGWTYDNLEMPPKENPPRPEFPGDIDKRSPEWIAYARLCELNANKTRSWDRLRGEIARNLFLVDFYGQKIFYQVHGIDFRGRIYPRVSGMSYQGDDFSRAVLRFAESKPILTKEEAMWFFVHGANCWGEDKIPFNERVEWVTRHRDAIIQVGQDPLEHRWWVDADKPWLFLAWCLEAAEFFEQGYGFESKIPCSMDGSNNGLQIYSLLLRDPIGAEATNCTPCERPADIYGVVADKVTARLKRIASGEESTEGCHREWAKTFLDLCEGEFPRAATKRTVMTYVYGATAYSRQSYVSEWYHDIVRGKNLDPPPFPHKDTYKATYWLAQMMVEELEGTVEAASEAMDWMQEASDILAKQGKHAEWVSPTGLRVRQSYRKNTTRKVRIGLRRNITVTVREDDKQIDPKRSRNGICPNFVHSLDAAAAALTVVRGAEEGITHFMMIHDSFGTHAADCPKLAEVLRDVYVDIFKENQLERLRSDLQKLVKPGTEIPPVPEFGSLDINDLRGSSYFFA